MTFFKTASAALVAATLAFGAMAPASATAFASDQGHEVAPVKSFKKGKRSNFRIANLDAKFGKKVSSKKLGGKTQRVSRLDKYLAIGAAVGAIGYALVDKALDEHRRN